MATSGKRLPLILRIHNAACPAWILNIGFLKRLEPGCRAATKQVGGEEGK